GMELWEWNHKTITNAACIGEFLYFHQWPSNYAQRINSLAKGTSRLKVLTNWRTGTHRFSTVYSFTCATCLRCPSLRHRKFDETARRAADQAISSFAVASRMP